MTFSSKNIRGTLLSILTIALALLMFFPIFWMALTSFKVEIEAISIPPSFFFEPTLENWRDAVFSDTSPFARYLRNTVVITFFSILLALIFALPTAYQMAYYPTKRTEGTMLWIMSTRMLPPAGVIVPVFIIFRDLNLIDTHLGLILLYAGMNFPLIVWMMRSFMLELPFDIIEAARLDGANLWQEFSKVIFPLLIPGLAATSLLALIFTWNEFFFAVNLTATDASPLSIYVSTFKSAQGGLFIAKMSAASTAAIIPVLIAGWVAQKQLVTGLTMGAVK